MTPRPLPAFLAAGLLCAGLALGCADSGTDSGTAATGRNAPSTPGTPDTPPAAPESAEPAWVADANVTQAHLQVTGMTWGGCAAAVRGALANLDGVDEVMVDHATGDVYVKCADGTELSRDTVAAAVEADPRFSVTEFVMQTPEPEPAAE